MICQNFRMSSLDLEDSQTILKFTEITVGARSAMACFETLWLSKATYQFIVIPGKLHHLKTCQPQTTPVTTWRTLSWWVKTDAV